MQHLLTKIATSPGPNITKIACKNSIKLSTFVRLQSSWRNSKKLRKAFTMNLGIDFKC